MKVENGKLVTIIYDLNVDSYDGELIESIKEDEPAIFLCGAGEMLETFEEKLIGLKEGDSFKFSLTKDQAYGDEDEDAIAEFPIDIFEEDEEGVPEVGDYVPMEDEEGNIFDGIVIEIENDTVVLDFNHPLAGEDLFFVGKVIKIEDTKK
ncbi:MAG: FKBP-type peptidyl-prolyl cis-trans isomerase [Bacteroidota bacterium]|jgi:FKBP-type peptidyl-prolyl cis-trans isomerase SlyD|nr:FKBP-type peptidyl-prolyl cis-trans isomerase [Bacteroidales bacterium]MDI9535318.1 FKBP-type peptidyl-prolyl cis-trans isomerase [Bacteroidota bacterium]OQC46852.1 MAG: FKBP-type 16 kDa peptidyl-prolyl cis-trans isomerase [Bacteroidetes bacterium ADurb.Bin028]NLP20559.1 peptidylprolyl isomerase [Bacteroidales bacterium]HNY43356.1 FKBP-type peptidyl-prolyl cis-trans isomerase [Bacteroidales bacterium]